MILTMKIVAWIAALAYVSLLPRVLLRVVWVRAAISRGLVAWPGPSTISSAKEDFFTEFQTGVGTPKPLFSSLIQNSVMVLLILAVMVFYIFHYIDVIKNTEGFGYFLQIFAFFSFVFFGFFWSGRVLRNMAHIDLLRQRFK